MVLLFHIIFPMSFVRIQVTEGEIVKVLPVVASWFDDVICLITMSCSVKSKSSDLTGTKFESFCFIGVFCHFQHYFSYIMVRDCSLIHNPWVDKPVLD